MSNISDSCFSFNNNYYYHNNFYNKYYKFYPYFYYNLNSTEIKTTFLTATTTTVKKSCDTCSTVTVYSICNVANPEIGIFVSRAIDISRILDVNGWSVYVSNINPDYKLYYNQESVVKSIYFWQCILCGLNIFFRNGELVNPAIVQ